MTASEPIRLSADPTVPLARWERGPAYDTEMVGPTWRGGWRVRDISDDSLRGATLEAGILALLTGRPRARAWHGGSVNNSYGYAADTAGAVVVALPDGRVFARRQQIMMGANKPTATGVCRHLWPSLALHFHGGASERSRQAALEAAAREAESGVVGGHFMAVHLHPVLRSPDFRSLYEHYQQDTSDFGRRSVIKDWLMDQGHPDADHFVANDSVLGNLTGLAAERAPAERTDARAS